jgi:hypothetical protein
VIISSRGLSRNKHGPGINTTEFYYSTTQVSAVVSRRALIRVVQITSKSVIVMSLGAIIIMKQLSILSLFVALTLPAHLVAQEANREEGEIVKLKPGTLASSTSSFGVKAVDQVTDGTVSGDPTIAVGGSVRQISPGKCAATISNSDADSGYSVSFEVLVKSSTGGGFPKRKTFTGTVPASGKMERTFSCDTGDNFQVNLTGGRRLKPKKKQQ